MNSFAMNDRDPNNLNPHLQVRYIEIDFMDLFYELYILHNCRHQIFNIK